MRGLFLGAACLAALLAAGCAKKSPSIARIEGSEPQRLAFGDPKAVQAAFTNKMKSCWFSGPGALLNGYRYEVTAAILDTGDRQAEMEQVVIRDGDKAVFVVQFNPFNENTLISTRSQGVPPQIAAQMKIDVETWLIERDGCASSQAISARTERAPPAAEPAPRFRFW